MEFVRRSVFAFGHWCRVALGASWFSDFNWSFLTLAVTNADSLTIQDNAANPAAGFYRAITPP